MSGEFTTVVDLDDYRTTPIKVGYEIKPSRKPAQEDHFELAQNKTVAGSIKEDITSAMASDREYVDLKLEAAEARNETRFMELNAKLDRIIEGGEASRIELASARAEVRQDYRSTKSTVIVTTLATGIALSALILAIMTYGDAIFSRGMSVRDVVSAAVKEQAEKAQPSQPSTPSGKSGLPVTGR